MKVLSLFSGIGAFEKALDNLGIEFELVNYCEIDKYASKSYSTIHGVDELLNLGDITTVDTSKLPNDIDLLTHGSPCQSFSLAGLQHGGDKGSGTRSSLMWETVRIISDIKPKIIIWENVKNVLSKNHKHNFDAYTEQLDESNYNSYYKILNSRDYGIPQNRERIFVVSIRKDVDTGMFQFPQGFPLKLKLKDMLDDEVDEKYFLSDTQINSIKTSTYTQNQRRIQEKDWCDTLCARDWKDPKCVMVEKTYKEGETVITQLNKVRKLTPKEYFRLQGFDDESFMRAEKVCSNTQLYKQAGNSIVVPVLEYILANLLECGVITS